jgi:hypothetical protein
MAEAEDGQTVDEEDWGVTFGVEIDRGGYVVDVPGEREGHIHIYRHLVHIHRRLGHD